MLPVVLVSWADAAHPAGDWVSVEDCRTATPALIQSAGFLVSETPDCIVVACSYDGSNVSGEMTIPTALISRRVVLRTGTLDDGAASRVGGREDLSAGTLDNGDVP